MFLCYPASTIHLHECLFPKKISSDIATIVAKAQCLRNELVAQRNEFESGLAATYHDALLECVNRVQECGGYADDYFVSKWCVGSNDWIVTISGVRGELCLALLATVYWCYNTKHDVPTVAYTQALESIQRLKETIAGWKNAPARFPLPDFEASYLDVMRAHCHAAMNLKVIAEIDGIEDADALTVKTQFARHAYELLAPIVVLKISPKQTKLRNVVTMCIDMQSEALEVCFYNAAMLEKNADHYDAAVCILDKGIKLLNGKSAKLETLHRNVSDLKSVLARGAPLSKVRAFDWNMIPKSECVMQPAVCAQHVHYK